MGFNHGIHRIHGTIVSLALLFGVVVSAVAAEPGITVEARQRYPWNGLVDVKCVLEGDGARDYKVTLAVKDETGGTNLPARTFWQNGGTVTNSAQIVRPGNLHFIWDANADIAEDGFECDRVSVKVQVEEKEIERDKVQLWKDGPYWATTNIGAEKPEDYGYYFWWGDTVGYKRENDKWVASDGSITNYSFYTDPPTYGKDIATLQTNGWITAEGVLAPEHDAAHVHWGGDWRMPTDQEIRDLNNNCNWTWTTINGVAGYVVRGKGDYASNSIFLPCAGYGYGTSLGGSGSYGSYWSSVPLSGISNAYILYFTSSYHRTSNIGRSGGHSVRPVQGFTNVITKVVTITFDANGGAVSPATKSCTANSQYGTLPTPTRSGYTFEGWFTASTDGTRVTDSSVVPDSATTLYAQWTPVQSDPPVVQQHDKVQLWEGGPYWATTNIGAEKPEDYGYYFWWGDTVGYKRKNNAWVASDGSITNYSFYTEPPTYGKDIATLQREGWITEDGVLAPEHDAAHIHWGGDWRMPTQQELNDLNNKCDWTWTTMNGVAGYVVRGRGDYASNSIFLPCAGDGFGTSLGNAGLSGDYWSSVPLSDSADHAWRLDIYSSGHNTYSTYRYVGQSVRPVQVSVSAPTNVSATDGTSTANVTITWSAVAGATSYEIWRGTSNDSALATKIGTSTSTSYSDTSAIPETIYYYWVKAVASVGVSAFSSSDSGYIKSISGQGKVQLWENGPYWATTNIGAEKPEDYGYYFWWGDTVGYKRENNAWVASDGSATNFSFTSSNTPTYDKDIATLQTNGWITAEGVLAPEHDAAHIHWGGDWRMPTQRELYDLSDKCDWTWTTMNGVAGCVVHGRGDYASNSIFLPCAGNGSGASLYYAGSRGYYWSSVPSSNSNLAGYSGTYGTGYEYRNNGRSVRPLQGFTK